MTFKEDEIPRFTGCSTLALKQECAKYGLKDGEDFEMAQRLERLWNAKKKDDEKNEEKKKDYKKEEKKRRRKKKRRRRRKKRRRK